MLIGSWPRRASAARELSGFTRPTVPPSISELYRGPHSRNVLYIFTIINSPLPLKEMTWQKRGPELAQAYRLNLGQKDKLSYMFAVYLQANKWKDPE